MFSKALIVFYFVFSISSLAIDQLPPLPIKRQLHAIEKEYLKGLNKKALDALIGYLENLSPENTLNGSLFLIVYFIDKGKAEQILEYQYIDNHLIRYTYNNDTASWETFVSMKSERLSQDRA